MGIFLGKKTEEDQNLSGTGAETGTGKMSGPSSTSGIKNSSTSTCPGTPKLPSNNLNQNLIRHFFSPSSRAGSDSSPKPSNSKREQKIVTVTATVNPRKSKSKTEVEKEKEKEKEKNRGSKRKAKISPLSRLSKRINLTSKTPPQPQTAAKIQPQLDAELKPRLSHDLDLDVDVKINTAQAQCFNSRNCEDEILAQPKQELEPKTAAEIETEQSKAEPKQEEEKEPASASLELPLELSEEMKQQIYSSPQLPAQRPIPASPCLFVPPIKIKIKLPRKPNGKVSISTSKSSTSGSTSGSSTSTRVAIPSRSSTNASTSASKTSRSHSDSTLEMNLTCIICGKVRITKESFRAHKIFHNQPGFGKDDYTFHCRAPLCLRSFRTEENLNLHLLSHSNTNETEFQCDYCRRHFIADWALEFHLTICPSASRQSQRLLSQRDCYSSKENFVYY